MAAAAQRETPTPTAPNGTGDPDNGANGSANMEEILSSIRSTLEEETAKVAGSDVTAASGADNDVLTLDEELSDEEILALSETDLAENSTETPVASAKGAAGAGQGGGELIDLSAFTSSGQVTTTANGAGATGAGGVEDVLGENLPTEVVAEDVLQAEPAKDEVASAVENEPDAVAAVGEAAVDDFDRLMNEIKQDKAIPHEQRVADLLDDEESVAPVVAAPEQIQPTVVNASVTPGLPVVPAPTGQRLELPAITGSTGLQVALPAEVLAEALRPLISSWLSENLPQVVERLVQAEISKLASQ